MNTLSKTVCLLLLLSLIPLLTGAVASSKPAVEVDKHSKLNDQERIGHAFFMQRCSFCHVPRTTKAGADAKVPSGGILAGLFRESGSGQETRVRQLVLKGIPGKMPGFEHGLSSEEIDAIIAYIKTLK